MRISLALLLLLLASSVLTHGQTNNPLIGKWTVSEVEFPSMASLPPGADPKQLNALKAALQQAVFVFNANGTCSLNIPDQTFQFENAQWTYHPEKKLINIHEKGTKPGSLMGIHILQQSPGESIFQLEETPIILKVKKS